MLNLKSTVSGVAERLTDVATKTAQAVKETVLDTAARVVGREERAPSAPAVSAEPPHRSKAAGRARKRARMAMRKLAKASRRTRATG